MKNRQIFRQTVARVTESLESRTLFAVYNVSETIPHDYSVDVTSNIQTIINNAEPGSTIVFPELAYDSSSVGYRIDGTLSINGKDDLTIEGNGAHFKAVVYNAPNPRERRHWTIGNSDDVTMQNMTIIGADPSPGTYSATYEAQHGIDVGYGGTATNVLIDNVDIYSVAGDFIYLGNGSDGITVVNSHFEGAGRQGIAPCNANNILIQNNYIGNVGRHVIDIEPYTTSWSVRNVRIIGNTTGESKLSFLVAYGAPNVHNVLVADNTVLGPNNYTNVTMEESGGALVRRYNWALVNNGNFHFNGRDGAGLRFGRTDGVIVAGNSHSFGTYPNSKEHIGIGLNSVVGAIVADNKLVDAVDALANNESSTVWTSDNLVLTTPTDDPGWESSTTMTELAVEGVYGFVIPYNGEYESQTITDGQMIVISRYTDDMTSVTFNGLTTTDRMAAVIVDENGNYVTGWALGEAGTSTFDSTTLDTLKEPAAIFESPKAQYGAVGQDVQFTVVATGDDLTYQWRRNGVDIPGATRAEYRHTVQANDNGALFSVIVDNAYAAPVTSGNAIMNVVTAAAPIITTQPTSVSLSAGHVATFTVAATGSQGPLSYQWKRGGVNIAGANASSYTTDATTLGDSGAVFTVVITNPTGSTTSSAATLTVLSEGNASESWTGANNDPWPAQWTYEFLSGSNLSIQGNKGQVGNSTHVRSYINTLNVENSDQIATVGFPSSVNNANFSLIARRADEKSSTYYFAQVVAASSATLRIGRMIDGVSTSLQTVSVSTSTTAEYKLRFACETDPESAATILKAKFWLATDPEPEAWTATYTDSTLALQGISGRVGLVGQATGNRVVNVDNYALTALPPGPAVMGDIALQAVAASSRHISLQWSDLPNELGYVVERSTDGTNWTPIANPLVDQLSFTDLAVDPATEYNYRIRAYNQSGFSSYSAIVTATTPAEQASPAVPGGLVAGAITSSEVTLNWVDNSSTEFGFRIERSPNGMSGWQQVGMAAAGATSFRDIGLQQNVTYYYRVYAYNNTGNSANTGIASTTTLSNTFSETWSVENGAWPTQWSHEGTRSVEVYNLQGRAVGATNPGTNVLSYINTANAENIEQIASFTLSLNTAAFGLFSRRTDANSDTYYYARVYHSNDSSTLRIYKTVDGVETSLSSYTFAWDENDATVYKVRFLTETVSGTTTLRARIWRAADAEPTSWQVNKAGENTAVLQGVSGRFGTVMRPSNNRTVTVDDYWAGPSTLAAPSSLNAVAASPNQINLSWTDNSSNEYGFIIQRSADGATNWQEIGRVDVGHTTFSDTGLIHNTTYYYRLLAYNPGITSSASSTASATTPLQQVSESFTGSNGSNWSAQWTHDGTGTFDIQGNQGRVGQSSNVVSYINTTTAENTDQSATFTSSMNVSKFGLVARRADNNTDTYYYAEVQHASTTQLKIHRVVDGVVSTLATSSSFSMSNNIAYKMRFVTQTNGTSTTLQAKFWPATDPEPGTWSATFSDSNAALQGVSGRFGTAVMAPSGRTVWIDNYISTWDNTPTISLVATDPTAVELGVNKGTFTITRSNTVGNQVIYYTIGGTASNGDYLGTLPGVATIPAGQKSVTLDIKPVNDTLAEAAETVILTLASHNSYVIATPSPATVTIYNTLTTDDLESASITGGSGWDGEWVLSGVSDVTTTGTDHSNPGSYHLRLRSGNGVATRSADLREATSAHLKFWWKASSFETGEYATAEIYDGTNWIEVLRVNDGQDDNVYHNADIDLSTYTMTSNFQVRFSAKMVDSSDNFYVDDIVIM